MESPLLNGNKIIRNNSLPKQVFTNITPNHKQKAEDNIINLSTNIKI